MNLNQPQDDDLDLGGIEGVKKRLASELVEQKVAALSEAFNYGQAGLDLVIEVLKDSSSPIQSVAYLLLKERAEQEVKDALQEYYGEKIKSHELSQEFVANTIDELRTPLNAIIAFQKFIMEGRAKDREEKRDFLEEANKFALNLHKRLNNIHDFAKIEAGKMNLPLGEVKLDELFKDVENFTRAVLEKKNLRLFLEMPTNSHEIILCSNYERLLQVISNLVDNAIKFTQEGGLKITAEVIKNQVCFGSGELVDMVKIGVCDTGMGVSLDTQNTLLIPFLNDGSFRRMRGYKRLGEPFPGLGLALSKRLVEKMGGEINFYSPGEGMGSTFTFTVPMYSSR